MYSRLFLRLLGLLFAISSIPSISHADTIAPGTFNISNIGGGTMTVGAAGVTFNPDSALVGGGNTGAFSGLTGTSITLNDITNTLPISQWVTTTNGISFNLTTLNAGSGTLTGCSSIAIGAQCTPAGSPYTFTQLPNTVSLTFSVAGDAYAGQSSGGTNPFLATFSTQFGNTTIADLVSELSSTGITTTYAAQFQVFAPVTAATPEPGTLLSSMTGLLLIGWRVAERKRRH